MSFAHPSAQKLIKLVNLSDQKDEEELKRKILEATLSCDKRYKTEPPRPVVGLPPTNKFNEVVTMDIKFHQGTPLLHLIDTCTRYSTTTVLNNKAADEVGQSIFKSRIVLFGAPNELRTDNGKEFDNQTFQDLERNTIFKYSRVPNSEGG